MKSHIFGAFLIIVAFLAPFQEWREVPLYFSILLGIVGLLLQFQKDTEKQELPPLLLLPWEIAALREVKEKRFTRFSELYFSYKFLEDPRNQILSRALKQILKDNPDVLEAFRAYCMAHRQGEMK